MLDLTRLIEGIEELAYNILIWVLLIPKTLAKIVFHPTWAPGYVAEQLKGDTERRFDDYISPVILIILATLMPFAYAYITPLPSVSLSGPTQSDINKDVIFTATANFISKSGSYTYEWGEWVGDTYNTYGTWTSDQTMDYISDNWDTPGWKTVAVTASNDKGESYYNQYDIYVVDPSQPASAQGGAISAAPPAGGETKSFRSVLEGTPGILAALGFLSIPLLFALILEAFRGNPISRSSLMRSFYIQCYYLSPFALAAWSLILGFDYFLTPSQWPLILLTLAVVVVMLLWLIRNETLLIAAEHSLHRGPAFGIVLGLIVVIGLAATSIILLRGDAEVFRVFLGWFYVVFVVGLVLTGFWRTLFRKRRPKDASKAK